MKPRAPIIVFSEAENPLPPSASLRDLKSSSAAARLAGASVYTVPADLPEGVNYDDVLWHVPSAPKPTPAFWIGYIPTSERYAALYAAAHAKNLVLVNTPEEHRNAQEFDAAYPRLGDLTPRSAFAGSPEEAVAAASAIGYPVFVKGVIQSRKSRGWKACVAETPEELTALTTALLTLENRSRGRVVLRELVPLRYVRRSAEGGFPFGREYRAFVYQQEIVGLGYYWEGDDPLAALTPAEERIVRELAREAARRVGTPYLTVDIGQAESGEWLVIETGDAQFSGLSRVAPLTLWHRLQETVD